MGNIGIHHFSYFPELEDAELTAICDIDPAKLKELKVPGDFDQAIAAAVLDDKIAKYTDYRAMLDSGKVDTVIIAAPHYFHPEMAVEAFRRGIHVICEKPVAIPGRQARR